MDLNGKRIVLLGGTSGIGFATARAPANERAKVATPSSKQPVLIMRYRSCPANAEGHILDLSSEDAIISFFENPGDFDHFV